MRERNAARNDGGPPALDYAPPTQTQSGPLAALLDFGWIVIGLFLVPLIIVVVLGVMALLVRVVLGAAGL